MTHTSCQRLFAFARKEANALLSFRQSDRPWQLPFAAAIASGAPVAAGAWLGFPSAGALGAVAGLSFLYLPATNLRHRIAVIMACAFAMTSSYALGLASHLVPGTAVLAIACLTAAALLFCRAQAVIPPGPIFMVMAGSIAALSQPQGTNPLAGLGIFTLGCIWACCVAVAYSMYMVRYRTPAPQSPPLSEGLEDTLVASVLTGLFVGLSLALATVLSLEKAYWVPVSCLAVMQGITLRASWSRNIHRIVGTVLGLGVTWLLLPFLTNSWFVAVAVIVLTFLIETAVVRHYAFAAMFITPLTILLAESSSPGTLGSTMLMQTRLIDTVVGALISLVGSLCLHNSHIRHFIGKWLSAIIPLKPKS